MKSKPLPDLTDFQKLLDEEVKIKIKYLGMKGGKPRFAIIVKSIVNFKSEFREKLLCDGWTYSLGSACHFKCVFCYVLSIVRQHPQVHALLQKLEKRGLKFEDVCIVRFKAHAIIRRQLLKRTTSDMDTPGVVFTSPLVDCAPTKDMALETAAADRSFLELTRKDVRHLSKGAKSNFIVDAIPEKFHHRLIFGHSLGTIEDRLAAAIEQRTASPTQRLEQLHWLQDHSFRTYGMICPVLPRKEYAEYAKQLVQRIRLEHLEHVWVEPLNVRGESMTNTKSALEKAGFHEEAVMIERISTDSREWEAYSRELFEAFAAVIPPEKYRFLQYPTDKTLPWWTNQTSRGAVLLGASVHANAT